MDYNTCDLCKEHVHTLDLIWLTSEDFKPLDGEILTKKASGLDAVCCNCYGDIVLYHYEDRIRESGNL